MFARRLPQLLPRPAQKNPLCKDDDTEFKKLAAVCAYATNYSTPGSVETQCQRIFDLVHGNGNGIGNDEADKRPAVLSQICEGTGPFDRLYDETSIADVNSTKGCTTKRFLKPLFSPNRNFVLLAAGEHIQVKWLRMKYLDGDFNDLVSGK